MPHKDSWNSWLEEFTIGERRYVECAFEEYAHKMRVMNTPISRRPKALEGRKFTTTLFTAVSAAMANDVRYLICVERVV